MPSGRKRLRQKMATHKRKKRLRKNRHMYMPSGRKRLRQKMATHKRKKRLRKNRHKKK